MDMGEVNELIESLTFGIYKPTNYILPERTQGQVVCPKVIKLSTIKTVPMSYEQKYILCLTI